MLNKLRAIVIDFISSKKEFPVVAALASGLYPLFYYYDKNFSILNSWSQFLFYVLFYLLMPVVLIFGVYKILSKKHFLYKLKRYCIPVFNLVLFTFFVIISVQGFENKNSFFILLVPVLLGVLLRKHFNKIIVLQYLLASLVALKLLPDIYRHFTYSSQWMQQPDNIEAVVFKKKPNIYIIQPDGYANFSELKKSNYNYDNKAFESFLQDNDFKLYENFRSNYFSTLSSNSSMFSMKHHYYNKPLKPGLEEVYSARDVIVGENPVISVFKKNNYKTFLLLEKSYLLLNRPKIAYDYSNLKTSDISFFSRGFDVLRDLNEDLESAIKNNTSTNNFFFLEKLKPGHIATRGNESKGAEHERKNYLKELEESNEWLKESVDIITKNDPNGLIVIIADHGGFVGLDYMHQCKQKQTDSDLINTVFSAALAIKWPSNAPEYDDKLKTNVNLFRVLFSYLSEDEAYLDNLQEDSSYTIIEKGEPFGTYKVLDSKGNVVLEKVE